MIKKINKDQFRTAFQEDEISIFMTCASFEERSKIISGIVSGKSLHKSFVFFNSNEHSKIVKNAKEIQKELGANSERVELNSDNPVGNYRIIRSVLESVSESINGNILIDTTTFTHETLLVLLKLISINKSKLGKVFISYLGAAEYSTKESIDEEKWLSKGIKEIRTILGYSGITDPLYNDHLMILFGFEFDRTRELIEQYEFKYISLGFANLDDSIQSNHWKINVKRHDEILREYPNSFKFSFSLIDHSATKKAILSYLSLDKFKETNTVIAPLNNKLSTIGAGLAAIEKEELQLAYAKPFIYNTSGYSQPGEAIYYGRL